MRNPSYFALFASLTLGSLVYAQVPQGAQPSPKSADGQKVSVTGCLMKGSTETDFVITDQKTGSKVPFAGPAQLEKYLNQTVRLTGTMSGEGADKVFKPESINQVAATCEKGQ